MASRPREQFTVSTKVGRLLVPNPDSTGSDLGSGGFDVQDALTRKRDYSGDGVRRSLEASLERLGLDRIDIVYLHDPEDHMDAAIGHAIPALVELRDQGVVGAIDAGMNFVDPLMRFATETDVDVLMVAGRTTILAAARAAANTCTEFGTTLPHAAMRFPLQHPSVACVVAGMRTSEQVRQNVEWATVEPPAGLFAALEAGASL